MKRTILTTTLLLLFILSGFAQTNGLEFKNLSTQKTKYIKEGEKIKVKSDGKTYKGRFEIISDSQILVESDTLLLSDIQDIRTKSFLSSLGGGLLFVYGSFGAAAMIYGISMIAIEGGELVILGILFFGAMGVGAAFIAAGGFALMVHGKSHKSKRWEYKAVTNLSISNNQVR